MLLQISHLTILQNNQSYKNKKKHQILLDKHRKNISNRLNKKKKRVKKKKRLKSKKASPHNHKRKMNKQKIALQRLITIWRQKHLKDKTKKEVNRTKRVNMQIKGYQWQKLSNTFFISSPGLSGDTMHSMFSGINTLNQKQLNKLRNSLIMLKYSHKLKRKRKPPMSFRNR